MSIRNDELFTKFQLCLFPTMKIAPQYRSEWDKKDVRKGFVINVVFFSVFGVVYILHFFLIDVPLKKQPIELWLKYRSGMTILSIFGLMASFHRKFTTPLLNRLPIILIGSCFCFMQAESMAWRPEVSYLYSVILVLICTLALRMSLAASAVYMFVAYALEWHGWSSRPYELPYIISASLVAVILASIIRSTSAVDVTAFIAEREKAATQEMLIKLQNDLQGRLIQAAHDIRAPLAALKVTSRMIPNLPEENRPMLNSAIDRINHIANDLLENRNRSNSATNIWNRIETISLVSLLENTLQEKEIQFLKNESINIVRENFEKHGESRIQANSTQLFRVFSNIIDNAVQSINEKGNIIVSLRGLPKRICVQIIDEGCGIPSNILNSIGSQGTTYGKKDGNGLGLWNAYQIIEYLGGSIFICSEINRGTTVSITLPSQEQ